MTVTPPPAYLMVRLEALRRSHGGVEFDADDPHRGLIEAACRALRMPCWPVEGLEPRTIRGRQPGQYGTRSEAMKALGAAMRRAHRGGRLTPSAVLDELAVDGWTLQPPGVEL
jgi:hypothetical protein